MLVELILTWVEVSTNNEVAFNSPYPPEGYGQRVLAAETESPSRYCSLDHCPSGLTSQRRGYRNHGSSPWALSLHSLSSPSVHTHVSVRPRHREHCMSHLAESLHKTDPSWVLTDLLNCWNLHFYLKKPAHVFAQAVYYLDLNSYLVKAQELNKSYSMLFQFVAQCLFRQKIYPQHQNKGLSSTTIPLLLLHFA